jgi:hypothetical protein
MYSTKKLINIFAAYSEATEWLKMLLDPVVQALDFHFVSHVEVTEDKVFVTAEWQGSYQSSNTEIFEFPTSLLQNSGDIIAYLKNKRAVDVALQLAERQKQVEISERAELERLRKKFPEVG